MADNERTWWYYNCSNSFHNERSYGVSTVRLFDMDTAYHKLVVGVQQLINFTLDKGNADFAGNVTMDGIVGNYSMYSPDGSVFTCGVTDAGGFECS